MGKYDDKVKNVQSKDKGSETALATLPTEAKAFIRKSTDGSSILASAAAGKLELGIQLYDMEPGDELTGQLVGKGSTQLPDPNTGAMRDVNTWQLELRHPETWEAGPTVSILGAAALDRQLDHFIERNAGVIDLPVVIFRGGKTTTARGRQLNEYQAGLVRERMSKVAPAGATITRQ